MSLLDDLAKKYAITDLKSLSNQIRIDSEKIRPINRQSLKGDHISPITGD